MIKQTIILIFMCLFFPQLFADELYKNDWEDSGYKGKIKEVRIAVAGFKLLYKYDAANSNYQQACLTNYYTNQTLFNSKGYLVEENGFYGGESTYRFVYEYTNDIYLTRKESYYNGNINESLLYKYTNDFKNVSVYTVNGGSKRLWKIIDYNDKGKMKNLTINTANGYVYKYCYIYDTNGLVLKENTIDNGFTNKLFSYKYDGTNLLEIKYEVDTPYVSSKYEYNSNGQKISYEKYDKNIFSPKIFLEQKNAYKYDEKGLSETIISSIDSLNVRIEYTHDQNGNLLEIKRFNLDNNQVPSPYSVETYSYTYW